MSWMNSLCPADTVACQNTLCPLFLLARDEARYNASTLSKASASAASCRCQWMRHTWMRRALRFLLALGSARGVPMNPRARGSSNIQWINRKDMSARTEDGVSLCQRALQIITELCLAGHVDREKCADIFPTESNIPGKGSSGKCDYNWVLFKLLKALSDLTFQFNWHRKFLLP